MKKEKHFSVLPVLAAVLLIFSGNLAAADKVVVIPLGGTVGNAVSSDVIKGKTFSSKAAGKRAIGSLEIRDGSTFYTNSIEMRFSLIPAGSFVMGSPDGTGDTTHRPVWPSETSRDINERQHVVTLTRSFYMQTTEVTQSQWEQVMGSDTNPSHFTACGMDCPVEMVSWDDAQNFLNALNAKEGRSNCNTSDNTCYSLPTESQWEYAARGGTVSAFYNGGITIINCTSLDANMDKIGWYCGNANNTTHPVAQKEPNTWGLYDMSGNVWEWCEDLLGDYPDGPVEDPTGGTTGSKRIVRGGEYSDSASYSRSACRNDYTQSNRYSYAGFRIILSLGQ